LGAECRLANFSLTTIINNLMTFYALIMPVHVYGTEFISTTRAVFTMCFTNHLLIFNTFLCIFQNQLPVAVKGLPIYSSAQPAYLTKIRFNFVTFVNIFLMHSGAAVPLLVNFCRFNLLSHLLTPSFYLLIF